MPHSDTTFSPRGIHAEECVFNLGVATDHPNLRDFSQLLQLPQNRRQSFPSCPCEVTVRNLFVISPPGYIYEYFTVDRASLSK